MEDFNSFAIMFYYIISTTYQKIGDLFCPIIFLDFRTVCTQEINGKKCPSILFIASSICYGYTYVCDAKYQGGFQITVFQRALISNIKIIKRFDQNGGPFEIM